jgi:hypothetical protein
MKNYCVVFFLLASFVYADEGVSIDYLKSDFCLDVQSRLDSGVDEDEQFKRFKLDKYKLFVGKSRLNYNPRDYYLMLSSHDFNGDGVEDLIAVDWLQKSKEQFFLAYYLIPDMGYLYGERVRLKEYFSSRKIYPRHLGGMLPLFPEYFDFEDAKGSRESESFVGYHSIEPIHYEGKVYIYAEKNIDGSKRRLIFSVDRDLNNINLNCIF